MMIIFFAVYLTSMILTIHGAFDPRKPKKESQKEVAEITNDEDELVKQERLRVENLAGEQLIDEMDSDAFDILRVSNLVKKYSRPDPASIKD